MLLHCCCAPCSSYVLDYLNDFFDITIYFYNPNVMPFEEYEIRLFEMQKLASIYNIEVIIGDYENVKYLDVAKGLENELEGSNRCFVCYELRLDKAANYAKLNKFDYFATTLTVSPYKNSDKINEIGELLASNYGVKYLFSNFKKNDGYKKSIELSKKYNLYRQNYCGCIFSKV